MKSWILLAGMVLAVAGVHADEGGMPPTDDGGFARVEVDVFQPYCVECHAGYGNRENVRRDLSDIQMQVDNGFMPLGGALPEDLKDELDRWIGMQEP